MTTIPPLCGNIVTDNHSSKDSVRIVIFIAYNTIQYDTVQQLAVNLPEAISQANIEKHL